MRTVGFFGVVTALVVLAATVGGFDEIDSGRLPIANSRAPTQFAELPSPDPHTVSDLGVVPSVDPSDQAVRGLVRVTSAVVNLRAGPGLDYRMITVAEEGEELQVIGARVGGWLPVVDRITEETAWVCGRQTAEIAIN